MRRLVVVLVLVLLVCPATRGKDDDLERALRLRDEATADWYAERYEDAVEKLKRADGIYTGRAGDHSTDRAVVLRAIAWNQSKLGLPEDILKTWHQLALLAKGKDALYDNLFSAFSAFVVAAVEKEDTEAMLALLDRARKQAQELGYPRIAAQVLHDQGNQLSRRGMPEESLACFEKAAAERLEIGDDLGRTWSLVCIANLHVQAKRHDEALDPLLGAYRIVHTKAVVEPQATVAWNLRAVLGEIEARVTDEKIAAWITKMVDVALDSRLPLAIPVDRLIRSELETRPILNGMSKKRRLGIAGLRPEVKADLIIRATCVAGPGDHADEALKLLADLDCGKGPVAPHLDARRRTALALVHADSGSKESFLMEAAAAAKAWKDLGDRGGREKALGELSAAVEALDLKAEGAAILTDAEKLRQSGKPGGAGSSGSAGGDRSGYAKLGLHDPLFAVGLHEGKIRIDDLVAERRVDVELAWKPRNASLNGLSVTVFGGYVTIRSLNYGGAAASSGAPGMITLDELGEYRPVPAKGRLLILKNGAVRYEAE